MNWLCSWLSMKRGPCLFVDIHSGQEVFEYIDCYGNTWMANYIRWGFRVKRVKNESF